MWKENQNRPYRPEGTYAENRQHLDLGLEGGKIGLWEFNMETGTVYFSPEWKRQLGYEDSELESRLGEWEDRLHPDDRDVTLTALTGYLEGQRDDYEVEFRLRHRDGSYRWIFSRSALQARSDGRAYRVSGCHVDISYEWKVSDNTVSRSSELCRIFGLQPEQFGPTFEAYLDRVHPEDRGRTKSTIERAFRECAAFEFEERIVRPNGATTPSFATGCWTPHFAFSKSHSRRLLLRRRCAMYSDPLPGLREANPVLH
jgi:PAS domain S-box-containing protein